MKINVNTCAWNVAPGNCNTDNLRRTLSLPLPQTGLPEHSNPRVGVIKLVLSLLDFFLSWFCVFFLLVVLLVVFSLRK